MMEVTLWMWVRISSIWKTGLLGEFLRIFPLYYSEPIKCERNTNFLSITLSFYKHTHILSKLNSTPILSIPTCGNKIQFKNIKNCC